MLTTRGWVWCWSPRTCSCASTSAESSRPSSVGSDDQRRAGEPSRRPALVDRDVGQAGTQHRLVRAQQRGEAHDVGAGPVEGEQDLRVGRAEHLAHQSGSSLRPGVVAVGDGVPRVGGGDGLEDARVDARDVVGGEGVPGGEIKCGHGSTPWHGWRGDEAAGRSSRHTGRHASTSRPPAGAGDAGPARRLAGRRVAPRWRLGRTPHHRLVVDQDVPLPRL